MDRRLFLLAATASAAPAFAIEGVATEEDLPNLRSIVVAGPSGILDQQGFNGFSPERPTNIKSASKSVISALVGIAIDRGFLGSPDQPMAPILMDRIPADPDDRLSRVTIGHLMSMQAGLERQSGANYGRWVSSPNWVRHALAAPFVTEPGTRMLYSTASTHLLSAILTRVTGRSTLDLARDWLGAVPEFRITGWDQDPQGIYLGGNQMAMSTRSLAAFGQLYLNRGRAPDGTRVLPQTWIEASWVPRTRSVFSGDGYGYGWFMRRIGGVQAYYGWGYGGQMLYVLPAVSRVIAITSNPNVPSARTGYRDRLHRLSASLIGT
ncbi:MAG: serine hydrolase [Pseudomonadota bacterium]